MRYALYSPMLIVSYLQARAAVLWDFRAFVSTQAVKSKVAALCREQCIWCCLLFKDSL